MSKPDERDILVYQALTNGLSRFWKHNGKNEYLERLTKQTTKLYNLIPTNNSIILSVEQLVSQFAPKGSNALLEAVTSKIDIDKKSTKKTDKYFYQYKPLSLSESIFPKKDVSQVSTDQNGYWKAFWEDFDKLPDQSFQVYFNSLVYLLHKYTWCLPARTENSYLDFSLYEQSRITAALTVCLYDFNNSNQVKAEQEELLLIEGDISGIQKFIYNPAFNGQELQDGIARRLRGRSFYLNLLLKTLTDYLVEELNLYNINVLWATGGHFLVIAPNTAAVKEKLDNAYKVVQEWFWKEFRGALGLIIADLPVKMDELKDFSAVHSRLGQITAKLKLQEFSTPLSLDNASLDNAWQNPWVLEMQDDICRDTGQDLSKKEVEISNIYQRFWQDYEDGENPPPRSLQSLHFDRIGRVLLSANSMQLRRAKEWVINSPKCVSMPSTVEEAKWSFSYEEVLIGFPSFNRSWLLTSEIKPILDAELCLRIANHKNPQIDFLSSNKTITQGFEFLADAVATEKNKKTGRKQIVEFHELAEKADGAKFLGVLRMDVDSLGFVFSKGFPDEEKSIAKVANLSRMLDMFFTGYLNTLVDKNIEGKEHNLYTTYAGGDDLFIVGAWNEVVDLAETINEKFKAYCGYNPSLHISGGVALCKGKYPIGRAAVESGELLDSKAKNLDGKNALAFMNQAIAWNDWPKVKETANKLIKGLSDGTVSRSFIYNLLALYNQYVDVSNNDEKKKTAHLLLAPKFLYSLVRNVTDKNLCVELETMIKDQQAYLSVIASYAALKTRSNNDKEDLKGVNNEQ